MMPALLLAAGLTLADLRGLATLQDPQIDRTGTRIALVVRRADFAKNDYKNQLVLVDARTGAQRVLVRERDDVSTPRWSPDGTRLAFLATPPKDPDDKEPPRTQLYVLRMDGGEPARVTDAAGSVGAYAWSPDGRRLAYLARDVSPDKARIDAHDDAFEVTDDAWTARRAPVAQNLWIVGAGGGAATRLTSERTHTLLDEPAFTPDGRTIYAVRAPVNTNHYRDRGLVAVDVARHRLRAIGPSGHGAGSPLVARDGRRLFWAAEHPQAFSQDELYTGDLAANGARDVTARLDRNVHFVDELRDGSLVTGANDGTKTRLYRVAPDGAVRAYPLGDVDLAGGATASAAGALAFVGTRPTAPSELYVLAPGAAAPRRLTAINAHVVAHRTIAPTRGVAWRAPDGTTVVGVLTEPLGVPRGRRAPLVLDIHGGPTATSTDAFNPLAQLLAARGWYVFQPNYRGSDNLGHRFAQGTVPGIASTPGSDILAGVEAVVRAHPIDTTRIGVSGWSEGGLLTSWLITHDTRWRAAFSGAAVNDWVGYHDLTDAKDFSPSFIGGSPWTTPGAREKYDAESPLTYAARVKTPTLIVTDAGDFRVPTPLSYEFYHALRAAGTRAQLLVYPVDGHFPSDPKHREDVNRRWVDWFATEFGRT